MNDGISVKTNRPPGTLSIALTRLRRDPWLFVPFFIAGLFLSFSDWLRYYDPIPIVRREILTNGQLTVEFVGYPTGISQTSMLFESLISLKLPYLIWGLGLQLLVLIVITAAGMRTITRTLSVDMSLRAGVRFLIFVLALDLLYRVLGSIDFLQDMGLFGIVILVPFFYVFVRLFAVPGLLAMGETLSSAVRQSSAVTQGRGWSVFGLILLFGIGSWLMAAIPNIGTILSTTIVAPLHAVVIAIFLERYLPNPHFGSR